MLEIKHILVPLDESNFAEHALTYAQYLLPAHGRLTILTVTDDPIYLNDTLHSPTGVASSTLISGTPPMVAPGVETYQQLQRQIQEDAQTYLARVAAVLQQTNDFEVEVLTRIGSAATAILETAREQRVDMIVMTAHGRTGLSRLVFGSLAETIMGQAPCPVLIIPETALPKAP